MKLEKNIIIMVVIALVLGGTLGFFGGSKYQQSRRIGFNNQFGARDGMRNGQFQQRNQGFRPVNGEIISIDDKSITVKLTDNSSKIILLTDNTAINKSTLGIKQDLKVGEKVAAFGTENSDGSITAQNIQLNPTLRGVPLDKKATP